ncbi:MAG: bestrophin family ion channel [Chitinophagaceae bacterium]
MRTGKSYKLSEFLIWTRRNIYWQLLLGIIPTTLYQLFHFSWLAIPWTVVAMLGSATAFIIGFKNQETYNRTWEARKIWGATISASRSWAIMCRDHLDNKEKIQELIYRQLAWLTALRYQLRSPRDWENAGKPYNREFKKYYSVPEETVPLKQELEKYISPKEIKDIIPTNNPATQLLGIQGSTLKKLHNDGSIDEFNFLGMHTVLREFSDHQGKNERIKNFPYPRQYATISTLFVKLFCILLPFGMLEDFDQLNDKVDGFLYGNMVWLVIPFSMLISWVFTSLEQVGEGTENPFEGSANDVPLSQMSRAVEIDIRQLLGETVLPPPLLPKNSIVL